MARPVKSKGKPFNGTIEELMHEGAQAGYESAKRKWIKGYISQISTIIQPSGLSAENILLWQKSYNAGYAKATERYKPRKPKKDSKIGNIYGIIDYDNWRLVNPTAN